MSQTPSNPPSPDEPQGQPPNPQAAHEQQGGERRPHGQPSGGRPGWGQQPGGHPPQPGHGQHPGFAPHPGQQPQQHGQPQQYGQPYPPGYGAPSGAQPGYGQQAQPYPAQEYGQPSGAQPGYGQALPQQPYGQPGHSQQQSAQSAGNDILVAMLAHLSGFVIAFLGWIPPLAIYFAKRGRSPFVRQHASEAANFQLTLLIPYVLSGVALIGLGIFSPSLSWIGSLLIALVWILSILLGVLGASGANKGAWYRYPVSIRFLK